jgi:hypothetical protein
MKIKIHSCVDLITNSSTEIFTVKSRLSVSTIREMLRDMCKEEDDIEWYKAELTVTELADGFIEITSWINDPEWLDEFIERHFKIIRHD